MRIRKLIIESSDPERLYRLREEYRDYMGFHTELQHGRLTVYALRPKGRRPKPQKEYKGAM